MFAVQQYQVLQKRLRSTAWSIVNLVYQRFDGWPGPSKNAIGPAYVDPSARGVSPPLEKASCGGCQAQERQLHLIADPASHMFATACQRFFFAGGV